VAVGQSRRDGVQQNDRKVELNHDLGPLGWNGGGFISCFIIDVYSPKFLGCFSDSKGHNYNWMKIMYFASNSSELLCCFIDSFLAVARILMGLLSTRLTRFPRNRHRLETMTPQNLIVRDSEDEDSDGDHHHHHQYEPGPSAPPFEFTMSIPTSGGGFVLYAGHGWS
jgi:hypothetical protein